MESASTQVLIGDAFHTDATVPPRVPARSSVALIIACDVRKRPNDSSGRPLASGGAKVERIPAALLGRFHSAAGATPASRPHPQRPPAGPPRCPLQRDVPLDDGHRRRRGLLGVVGPR